MYLRYFYHFSARRYLQINNKICLWFRLLQVMYYFYETPINQVANVQTSRDSRIPCAVRYVDHKNIRWFLREYIRRAGDIVVANSRKPAAALSLHSEHQGMLNKC